MRSHDSNARVSQAKYASIMQFFIIYVTSCWDEKDVRFAPEPNPLAELGNG